MKKVTVSLFTAALLSVLWLFSQKAVYPLSLLTSCFWLPHPGDLYQPLA